MSSSDKAVPEPGEIGRRVRLAATILLLFLLAFGAYYVLYVQKKTTYLVGRNLRLLATLGGGLRASALNYGKFLETRGRQNGSQRTDELTQGLKGIDCGPQAVSAGPLSRHPHDPVLWWAAGSTAIDIAAFPAEGAGSVCGRLSPEALFQSLSESHQVFNGVLLARRDGEVVYQSGIPDLGITRLAPLLDRKEPKKGEAAEASDLSFAAGYHEIEIGGRNFKLFIEPLELPIGSSLAGGGRDTWLLCGLVPADEFVYKAMAIPSSSLLAVLAVLLLAALSWPLVRLQLMGRRQRIRAFDVLLLAGCTLLGVAILTLALRDFYSYAELKSVSEDQLRQLAEEMAGKGKGEGDIWREIQAAHVQMAQLALRARYGGTCRQDARTEPPWIDFELVDSAGEQKLKWTPKCEELPLIPVNDRRYFQSIVRKETFNLSHPDGGQPVPFYLEFVTAWSTHEPEVVLAEPLPSSWNRDYAIATLGVPMHSLIEPVMAPGFEFAVINDEDGLVLFHSNRWRNGVENFFTETDGDRRLRSAVFARRSEEMDIRYFGEDYRAALHPIPDMPWTVVALRSQEQLRALNMEWVVATLLFLLISAAPLVTFVLIVALARPDYRAPWVWPEESRTRDYAYLAVLLALYGLAFILAIVHLSQPRQLVGIAWVLPFLALLTSYICLQRKAAPGISRLVAALSGGALLLAILIGSLWTGLWTPNADFRIDGAKAAGIAVLILFTCVLSVRRRTWQSWPLRDGPWLAQTYPAAALLLLTIVAVLPTLAVFKAMHRIELHSFIRYGQLKIAKALLKGSTQEPGFYGSSFFETQTVNESLPKDRQGPCDSGQEGFEESPLPDLLESLLPHYSLHSSEMRELLHERAGDCSWDAHRVMETSMDLHSRAPGHEVHLRSRFPRFFSGTRQEFEMEGFFGDDTSTASTILGVTLSVGLFFLFVALLLRLVLFIAQRLFLLDLREPLGMHPIAGLNLFVVQKGVISPEEAFLTRLRYFNLREILSGTEGKEDLWKKRCHEVITCEDDVLLVGFEYGVRSPEINILKLDLLENLIRLSRRTVIVLSRENPSHLFSHERRATRTSPATEVIPTINERWHAVLSSFTLIEEDSRSAPSERVGRQQSLLQWLSNLAIDDFVPRNKGETDIRNPGLRKEISNDAFLQSIARDMDDQAEKMERQQILEEFGERAESYYRVLWESCSTNEKVVLQHLAQEGLVNEKNRREIRRLMARGLIRRSPNFCLMNETFRRFVSSPECRSQVLKFEDRAAPSAWDRFQRPFFAVLAASLVFFFATQQELLDSTLAVVTGLTAGLPTITKIVDLLSNRRSTTAK